MTSPHDDQHRAPAGAVPTASATLVAAYVAAFASGDAAALEHLYEDTAVLIPAPGSPVTGTARAGASAHLVGLGIPMRATLRQSYEVGDIALLLVD